MAILWQLVSTPPGSVFEEPPLTSPETTEKVSSSNAGRVLKHLEKLYRAHHQLNPWWEVRLGPQIYDQVLSALRVNKSLQAYVEEKIRFTVWRPDYLRANGVKELRAKAVIEAEVFRNDDGSPAEGVALQIPLREFAPKKLSQSYGDMDQVISISSRQLCDFLSSVESRQRVQTQQAGVANRIDPGTLKRRRPRTPSDHPSSEDERQFNKRTRGNKRYSQSSDYRPESSSGDSTTLKIE
ncbi:hypothetical protein N7501_011427 [Penicillium viridicatum]|nr:hypothetical protein N7501_011427 [Penicillium viridicatum]